MTPSQRRLLESPEFRSLLARRWRVSLVLCFLLFVVYYGYIALIALNPAWLSQRIGSTTTMGIPIGIGVIVAAWVLTGVYVFWANREYDPEVERLRQRLKVD